MHLTFLSTVTGAEQAAFKKWNRISVLYVMRIILPFCVQAHAFLSNTEIRIWTSIDQHLAENWMLLLYPWFHSDLVNVVLIQVKPVQNRQLITRPRSKQTMFVADLFMIDHVYNRPITNRLVHARRMFTTHHVHNRPVGNRSVINVFCFEWSVTSSDMVRGCEGSWRHLLVGGKFLIKI